LKLGRRSKTGREKRVTPEFGEYERRKILPPNLGRYKPTPLKESRPRDSRLASKEFGILGLLGVCFVAEGLIRRNTFERSAQKQI
jgi:hypothetical protein